MDDYHGKHSTQATSTVSETERLLSKLGHGYKRAKAQQILRLLKDQESLNQRFKDCALNEDDDNDNTAAASPIDSDPFGPDSTTPPENKDGASGHNPIAKKVFSTIDPSRCRTSMGFYNEAECSGSVDGNKEEIEDFEAETDAALMEEREALLGPLVSNPRLGNPGSRRLFRLQLDENEAIMEETGVQSARSSRPKTGIATGSAKSKQYRRPAHTDVRQRATKDPTISTSVSKLEGPMTPRGTVRAFCDNPSMPKDDYGCLVSTPRNSTFHSLTPRYAEINGNQTAWREDTANRPTPRPNDSNLLSRHQHEFTLCLTPRNPDSSLNITPCHNDRNGIYMSRHNDLPLNSPRSINPQRNTQTFYNSQCTPREDVQNTISSPRLEESALNMTPRTHAQKYKSLMAVKGSSKSHGMKTVTVIDKTSEQIKSTKKHFDATLTPRQTNKSVSLAERGLAIGVRMPTTPRSMITVDQSPAHALHGGPEPGEVVTPRRQKNDSNKSKNNMTSLQRSGVHQNLSKISERVHPIAMMKLPPLEVTMNKPVIS